jgi:uncharacterized protein YjdB
MRAMYLSLSAVVMACSDPTAPAISPAVTSVTIEPAISCMEVGSTLSLKVIVRNVTEHELPNRTIVFTSSNERVLSVDGKGLVRALAEGTATLTASTGGKSGKSIIDVLPPGDACRGFWDYSPTP